MEIPSKRWILVFLLCSILLIAVDSTHAIMMNSPATIEVAVTNFAPDRKDNCSLIQLDQIQAGYSTLGDYISAHLNSIKIVPFKQYTQRVLPHEWNASWGAESLKSGEVLVTD